MKKKIYVTEINYVYSNKILEIEETYRPEINDGEIIWLITSVNGEGREEGDWFWKEELEKLNYMLVDAAFEKLLVFL